MNVEDAWCHFSKLFNEAMLEFIPKTRPNTDKRKNIWMNKTAMSKLRKKYNAWKRYINIGDYIDYVRAAQEKNKLTQMTRQLCRKFEKDLSNNIRQDPKAFWRYVRSKSQSRSTLGDIATPDGTLTPDGIHPRVLKETAEIMAPTQSG